MMFDVLFEYIIIRLISDIVGRPNMIKEGQCLSRLPKRETTTTLSLSLSLFDIEYLNGSDTIRRPAMARNSISYFRLLSRTALCHDCLYRHRDKLADWIRNVIWDAVSQYSMRDDLCGFK